MQWAKGTWVKQWWALNRACPGPQAQEEPHSCWKKKEEEQWSTGSLEAPPTYTHWEAWRRAQVYKHLLISVEKSVSRVFWKYLWGLLAARALFGGRQVNSFMWYAGGARSIYCCLWALLGRGLQHQHWKKTSGLRLPDLANKNTERPVKFKSQRNNK